MSLFKRNIAPGFSPSIRNTITLSYAKYFLENSVGEHEFSRQPMRSALSDLKLQRLDLIHAGDKTFPLSENIRAVAVTRLLDDLKPLR